MDWFKNFFQLSRNSSSNEKKTTIAASFRLQIISNAHLEKQNVPVLGEHFVLTETPSQPSLSETVS